VSAKFSAVLLAGGKSSRMGTDKSSLQIDGVPLWRRQLRILQTLGPTEIFVAGPPRPEWVAAAMEIVSDAKDGAGPLAGLVAGLRRCTTALLLALAVDLAVMDLDYLKKLVVASSELRGVVPTIGDRFEPLAAVYPITSLPLAENLLRLGRFSLQDFSASCVAHGLLAAIPALPDEERLFTNVNTPEDFARLFAPESSP
jgi:molybdopterin-guanine dinucleotide biosynthesis protein A